MTARIRVSSPAARTMDGVLFASRAEMNRYAELRMMERAGIIRDLEIQPEYILQAAYIRGGKKIQAIKYRADFRYLNTSTACIIVEDCKGMKTEIYKLKKKLLLAQYPELNFIEVKAR